MVSTALAPYEYSTFTVLCPFKWKNMARHVRVHDRDTVFAYFDIPRRSGVLGRIADMWLGLPGRAGVVVTRAHLPGYIEVESEKRTSGTFTTIAVVLRNAYVDGEVKVEKKHFERSNNTDVYDMHFTSQVSGIGPIRGDCRLLIKGGQDFGFALFCWAITGEFARYDDNVFRSIRESFTIK
ncbi:MAG: hypothetical protein ACREXX_22920 [Gammaproteobacteria bacterium]